MATMHFFFDLRKSARHTPAYQNFLIQTLFCSFFKDFLGILSKVSRGSVQEKLQWVFGLYDLNGDGLISKAEMVDVVTSIYEMLGRATHPLVDDTSAKEHVEKIFHVSYCKVFFFACSFTMSFLAD